jgi:hypothetical protein
MWRLAVRGIEAGKISRPGLEKLRPPLKDFGVDEQGSEQFKELLCQRTFASAVRPQDDDICSSWLEPAPQRTLELQDGMHQRAQGATQTSAPQLSLKSFPDSVPLAASARCEHFLLQFLAE